MSGPFVHLELLTPDIAKAKGFYAGLFGWSLEAAPVPGVEYTLIKVGDGVYGGMMQDPRPGGGPPQWMPYMGVDRLEPAVARAMALGATVCKEITEVPNAGRFCIVRDPTGAVFGLWECAKRE